jgi:hypothetical protein
VARRNAPGRGGAGVFLGAGLDGTVARLGGANVRVAHAATHDSAPLKQVASG